MANGTYKNILEERNAQMIEQMRDKQEVGWSNPAYLPFDFVNGVCELVVSDADIEDAKKRLERFAPFIMKEFPETRGTGGLIESPLVEIDKMQEGLKKEYTCEIPGRLFLKKDSHLAIAGSVKARGGIYEVLKHAEDLALKNGMLKEQDSYEVFADEKMKEFLEQNEGLASRIAFHLNFPDYSPVELTQILDLMLEKSEYRMDERTREKCFSICADACREENYGNGRFVRNLLDHAIMRQADRLIREHQNGTLEKEEACLLTADDFEMIGLKKKPQSRQIGFCAG